MTMRAALPNYRRRKRLLLLLYMATPAPVVVITDGRALAVVPACWFLWWAVLSGLPDGPPAPPRLSWTTEEILPFGLRNVRHALPGFVLLVVGPALLGAGRLTIGLVVTALGALAAAGAVATARRPRTSETRARGH
jgi:hypothetical protein